MCLQFTPSVVRTDLRFVSVYASTCFCKRKVSCHGAGWVCRGDELALVVPPSICPFVHNIPAYSRAGNSRRQHTECSSSRSDGADEDLAHGRQPFKHPASEPPARTAFDQTLLEQMKSIFKKVQAIPPSKIPPTVGLNGEVTRQKSRIFSSFCSTQCQYDIVSVSRHQAHAVHARFTEMRRTIWECGDTWQHHCISVIPQYCEVCAPHQPSLQS